METSTHKTGSAETRLRLLDAAARVFARQGLEGATTREIAREASVNEVTLFRHFHSKEKLLSAVLQRTFDRQDESLLAQAPVPPDEASATKADLRAALERYARQYQDLLQRNILLVRTLLGEIHRHREHEMRVLKGIFAPLKAELVASIEAARELGAVRAGVEPVVAADMLAGMIFTQVLRRTSHQCPDYSGETYLETCVDVFARGIEQQQPL